MKVGDIVIVKPSRESVVVKNLTFARGNREAIACPSSSCLEVLEDHGETILVRCVRSTERHTVRKDDFQVAKALEQRLEENDLKPVIGKIVEP